MSTKEQELEKAAEAHVTGMYDLDSREDLAFHRGSLADFKAGAKWQASHTPAVSVEGEKAYEAWCEREGNLRTDFEHDAYLAGFQARSPLVELLKDVRSAAIDMLEHVGHVGLEGAVEKIDKALGEEK